MLTQRRRPSRRRPVAPRAAQPKGSPRQGQGSETPAPLAPTMPSYSIQGDELLRRVQTSFDRFS